MIELTGVGKYTKLAINALCYGASIQTTMQQSKLSKRRVKAIRKEISLTMRLN